MSKTLCLGMMVKNEALNIRATLEAAKPIIDYWVICDTGSTDDTEIIAKEVLKGIPGEYVHRPWVNFGYNHSEVAVLTKNKADYSLMLDGDFLIELNGFDKNKLVADQYDILIHWVGTGFYNPLLFSNRLAWKSVGCVHEYWYAEGIKSREQFPALSINHDRHGPARPKGLHDLVLLEQGVKDEPNNSRYRFYLANTLRDVGQYEKAIEMFSKRVSMGGWEEEVFYSKYQIGYCFELMKELNKAKIAYLKAWEYRPSRAEPLYKLAYICRNAGEYQQAYLFAMKGLEIPKSKDIIFVNLPTYDYCLLFEKAIASYWIGKYEESWKACKLLDSLKGIPEDVRTINRKNISHNEQKLFNKTYLIERFPGEKDHGVTLFSNRNNKLKSQNLKDMKEIEDYFKNKFDLQLYMIYGTLLGSVRDNTFISGDNDIDLAYLSKFNNIEDVKKEVENLAWDLRHAGLLVKCHGNGGQLRVSSPSNKTVVDVWTSWIENDEYHIIPYRKIGNKEDVLPLIKKNFYNTSFMIPNNSEKILDAMYVDWKNPIPKNQEWSKLKEWKRLDYKGG